MTEDLQGEQGADGLKGRLYALLSGLEKPLAATRFGRFVLDTTRAGRSVARGFRGEKISLRASALTYITILSLVPMLAVAFAIVRAAGQESLRNSVREFVFTNLAPGTREQIGEYLDQFIARASAGAMGGLGGLFLLLSALSLLHNIERSMNEIWGVTRPRPLLQRALIFWAVLTLGPIGLGTSLLATAWARSFVEGLPYVPTSLLTLIPLGIIVSVLTFLYAAAPNARVRLRAALAGGVVAGAAWELAKYGYALYASKSIQYSAIYGSLGAIPLFLAGGPLRRPPRLRPAERRGRRAARQARRTLARAALCAAGAGGRRGLRRGRPGSEPDMARPPARDRPRPDARGVAVDARGGTARRDQRRGPGARPSAGVDPAGGHLPGGQRDAVRPLDPLSVGGAGNPQAL
jgi:YihY family inner membrane protein